MNNQPGGLSVPAFEIAKAVDIIQRGIHRDDPFRQLYLGLISGSNNEFITEMRAKQDRAIVASNIIAKAFRDKPRAKKFDLINGLIKSGVIPKEELAKAYEQKTISKSVLDVGTLTNFASITGGQSLGYVSLDTQMARSTVRPNSFTLYQSLHKSAAFQVVDYWATAQETGGGLPGTAFTGYSNVNSGSLTTSAGLYGLSNITLKLAVNGRAITTALAAQNSFVDITAQENINAALTILESLDWCCYWGNPTLFTNQFQGIQNVISTTNVASGNIFDYQVFYNANASAQSWSAAQTMFNLIYQAAAQITSYHQNGRITHAFMSPVCAGSLQGLVTTLLNNLVNRQFTSADAQGIIVDGDLQGMKTRFGEIQFPIDLLITARDVPAQAITYEDGSHPSTTTAPTPPVSVTAILVTSGTAASGSSWTASYTATSGIYSYAVASLDTYMNESNLTYLSSGVGVGSTITISGVGAQPTAGCYQLTITGPVAADEVAFRIYRSGLGYQPLLAAVNPAAYRQVATVASNGSGTTLWNDQNTYIPGSETVFLLDMDEADNAIDYRFLLPLTKIELFAQNLFMPWAVASIGSIRVKIPKFHGYVKNYVPDNPSFNPLAANTNAVVG